MTRSMRISVLFRKVILTRIIDPQLVRDVLHKRDSVCLYGIIYKDGCQGGLSVHHIKTRGSGGDDVPENLITLCQKHHHLAQGYRINPDDLREILTRFFGYKFED
jgi:hypothetical protein